MGFLLSLHKLIKSPGASEVATTITADTTYTAYVSDAIASVLLGVTRLIFVTTLCGKHLCSHYMDKEIETGWFHHFSKVM